jgi:gliding motility-associated-like protein
MKKIILLTEFLLLFTPCFSQYSVKGGAGQPLLADNNINSRIEVYLLNGLQGAEISFKSAKEEDHQWYKYNTRAGEAIAVSSQQNGNISTVTGVESGYGYFVGSPADPATSYLWIIDYSRYRPLISSFFIREEEDKCEYLKLITNVEAPALYYNTYSGARIELQRTYHLLYDNLEWNENIQTFIPVHVDERLTGVLSEIVINSPLQNTSFTLKGDDYAAHFGMENALTTPVYEAIALDVHCKVISDNRSEESGQGTTGSNLGGSAPVEINFTAYANEPVAAMYIWSIFKINPETRDSVAIVRYTDKSLTYTFGESGSFVARLEVVANQSVCFDNSQIFNIFIGNSSLRLPNAFSPGSSPGFNDEYRVSYKSLISFKASIYNRWGNLLYSWDDPAKGWDGKVNGRLVPAGVYYIVVEAKGSDGKKYKETRDINILRSKSR